MSENVLKKEFKEKDVQRLRNLVQGKYGEKTSTSIGYTKEQEFHNEIYGKKIVVNGLLKMV